LKAIISLLYVLAIITISIACQNITENKMKSNNDKDQAEVTENQQNRLYPEVQTYIESLPEDFDRIPEERKEALRKLAASVGSRVAANEEVRINFICTHNSRRSHLSQIWAQTAAWYYGFNMVQCYSGGTETTAFNPRAVRALQQAGLVIEQQDSTANPLYVVSYASEAEPLKAFSKVFDDPFNPQSGFIAVMTCSEADEACPVIPNATQRFSLPFEDPKVSDDTPTEEAVYSERCRQIATEMFYLFSAIGKV
jgi:protein-tyrosine-phosphatase